MRDNSNHIQLSREEAVASMLELSGLVAAVGSVRHSPLSVEHVAIADAAGRVLASAAGEDRPHEAMGPNDTFFSPKLMNVSVSAEGRLGVRPVYSF